MKGNKILLSLAPIVMQTILAPNLFKNFLAYIFHFDANKRISLGFKECPTCSTRLLTSMRSMSLER